MARPPLRTRPDDARELARRKIEGATLRLITPKERPLALFGDQGSESVGGLLVGAGIEFDGSTQATVEGGDVTLATGERQAFDCVVTPPPMSGAGVPATESGAFVPIDECGRVQGVIDVDAAGHVVDFPIKQGGLAAQQADTVAAHIARSHGAGVDAAPFRPVLRGMLLTGTSRALCAQT